MHSKGDCLSPLANFSRRVCDWVQVSAMSSGTIVTECFLQQACFLVIFLKRMVRCRLRERIPRPVTIIAWPVLVVTAARWVFSEVHRGLVAARGMLSLRDLDTDMQLKALVPHQPTRPTVLWQIKRQDKRGTTSTHRQDHEARLVAHGLSRPADRVKALRAPGILHPHLRVCLAELTRRLHVGKEGMSHHLHRLAMQSKACFRGLLQLIASGPFRMGLTCGFMGVHTQVPRLGGFHLSDFQTPEQCAREMIKAVDFDGIHE